MRQQLEARKRLLVQAQYTLSVVGVYLLSHQDQLRTLLPAKWGAGIVMVMAVLRALQATLPPKP